MKAKPLLSISFVLLLAQSLWAYTGREIMEKASKLPEPRTAKSHVMMYIHKGKQVIEKEFGMQSKEFENDEVKTLISFIRPTKIKLLTHSHKGKDDDLWMRLSSGKIKRITSADMGKSFMSSHFYFEDMRPRGLTSDIDEYDYKYLGDDTTACFDCYKVEAIKKKEGKVYSKGILYVRKSDFLVVRADLYKKGKFLKYLEVYDIKTLDGILTPFRAVMYMVGGKGKTELKFQSVKYNMKISISKFNKEALR